MKYFIEKTWICLALVLGIIIGKLTSNNIEVLDPTPCICIDEFKATFDERSCQYHNNELNCKQYKDSLYSDLQKYYILNR